MWNDIFFFLPLNIFFCIFFWNFFIFFFYLLYFSSFSPIYCIFHLFPLRSYVANGIKTSSMLVDTKVRSSLSHPWLKANEMVVKINIYIFFLFSAFTYIIFLYLLYFFHLLFHFSFSLFNFLFVFLSVFLLFCYIFPPFYEKKVPVKCGSSYK